jgi:oligopeptide transport system substrate-binding protein
VTPRNPGSRFVAATAIAALALAVGALAGCGRTHSPDGAQMAPARGPAILLRGNGPDPDSLDPQKARAVEAQNVLRDLCEGLTTLARDGKPAPGVAKEWTATADGLDWTFHLRADARWSNGDPVVAEDFVAGLRRLVDPATGSQYGQVVDVIENASDIIGGKKPPQTLGVRAPDATTVTIRLRSPAPYLPGLLAHPSTCPAHRPSLAQSTDASTKPGAFVGNGAFVLREWVQNSHILLERNRRYWNDGQTRLDGVRFVQTADANAELRLYRAGQLDVTYVVPRGQFDWVTAHFGSQLRVSPQLGVYYYGFNLDQPRLRDAPKLRQALAMVIDRERLASAVLRVGELPAYSWVPPGTADYTPQEFAWKRLPLADRIREAQKLYAEAGYSRERPLRFELRYNSGEVHDKVAVAVASMWKEALGVEPQLVGVEFKSLMQDIDQRKVDVFRLSWLGDYNDAYTFAQYLKSDFGINLPHYRSAAYDALLARAAAQVDVARRRALLEEAERTMLADHPVIPLYFYVNKHLVSPRVQGWYDNVMNVTYSKDLGLTPR